MDGVGGWRRAAARAPCIIASPVCPLRPRLLPAFPTAPKEPNMSRHLPGLPRAALSRMACAFSMGAAMSMAPLALAQQDAGQEDGIRLQRGGSAVRNIVPVEVIEQQAAQEYEQIKQEAIAKHALAG